MRRLETFRAELMMRVGGFMGQNHESAFKRRVAGLLIWANRRRYSKDALNFLDEESSIDIFDYSEADEAKSASAKGPDHKP